MIQINIFSVLCIFILLINVLHFLNNQSSERQNKSPKIAILSGNESEGNHTRIILFWNTFWEDGWFHIGKGYQPFENCLYKNCYTTRNRTFLYDPNYIIDAVVFYGVACPVNDLKKMKRFTGSKKLVYQKNQGIRPKIILLMNESPKSRPLSKSGFQGVFDLTVTYRLDSEVYLGYGSIVNRTTKQKIIPNSFLKYDENHLVSNLKEFGLNELVERTKDIAWLVSHCKTIIKREDYVKEMKKYKGLQIDIFGGCTSQFKLNSTLAIPGRFEGGWEPAYHILAKEYKFYISFENTRCLDYITEKFFTALKAGMIPVVMGGLSKRDYEKIAPPHSYLHVDDFSSPGDLMKKLHEISKDPLLYNSYFWWRSYYSAVVLYNPDHDPEHQLWRIPGCQLCGVLNSEHVKRNNYSNFTYFWNQCK